MTDAATMIVDLAGWGGAVALLAAYALQTLGTMDVGSESHMTLNVGGSAALLANGAAHAAWPSVFLNLLWLSVGITGLIRACMRRCTRPSTVAPSTRSCRRHTKLR